jgi:Uncharacterized protein conserved in bacteria (DUF2330)
MRRACVSRLLLTVAVAACAVMGVPPSSESACCYFAAKDKDVLQPAQKAFVTWDPAEKVESFTVQPKFEGNALDFGMVIPTPARPKLDEMPRDFFKELAVFTVLEPMDLSKYKRALYLGAAGARLGVVEEKAKHSVRVLEAGIVGSLDYKIIQADRADDLYAWLRDNKYSYSGDEATLDYYIKKGWTFTVMKIDTMQMKKRADGTFDGEVTPTRFTFPSDRPVYPLKITQISVKDHTEALFYVQAPDKMDLAGDFSYEFTWTPMWAQATSFAVPEKLSGQEKAWQQHVQPSVQADLQKAQQLRQQRHEPATLEWARKITEADVAVLEGKRPYDRDAPREDVEKLKLLKGHVRQGQFVTKLRKVFARDEMAEDLLFTRARVGDKDDDLEYVSILPTSPP